MASNAVRETVTVVLSSHGDSSSVFPTCHTVARCPAAIPPGVDKKLRSVETLTADEAREMVASRKIVLVPLDDFDYFSVCSFCARGSRNCGRHARATVEHILRRLRVPLESVEVKNIANTSCATQVLPEALGQACFMHVLTTPERLGLASCPLAACREQVPPWKDAVVCDQSMQLLFHKPTGGVEENTELRAMLLPLFYAARPRLGTPPALSRRAADKFINFKLSPSTDTQKAMRDVAAAVAFMPPLRILYGLLSGDMETLFFIRLRFLALRFTGKDFDAGVSKRYMGSIMIKEVALKCLEVLADEDVGALDDSNGWYLVALKRLQRRNPSHASAVCFYLDSVVGRNGGDG
jgi:hypothetical protein